MKAIILAAGRGSRMGELTDELPKCRAKIHDKELLSWQIEALQGAGITELGLVRGYKSDTFKSEELTYFENARWNETNMVSSLLSAREWLESDTCVVSYSDIVYSSKIVERLLQDQSDIALTFDPDWKKLWQLRFENPLDDAESFRIDENNTILEIGNKEFDISRIEGQYMGLLKFTKKGWSGISGYLDTLDPLVIDNLDMTSMIKKSIAAGITVKGVPIAGWWCEIDSQRDLQIASSIVPSNGRA